MKVFGDTKQIKKSVNTQTQNMNMIVDEKAFSILIDKLYSNKKYAIMREIASNAVDAHLAAGIDKPFDVTLPTMTSKELIIRDYGAGLSYDDCYYYLGTIFGSKSQNADNLIGGFGLGSKSPFCLVSSYHITSRHNGLEHKFLYLREQNGIPQFIHVYSEPTNEPSGIEFVIDVGNDTRDWVEVAIRNLSFFKIKPNFINQKDIKLIEPLYLTDYLLYVEGYNYLFTDTHMVSMGGVVYSIPEYAYRNLISDAINKCNIKSLYNSTIILDFEIGELDISPSREHIEMTDKTKKSIKLKCEKIKNSGLGKKVHDIFLDNINEHGYIKGFNMGLARFYDGAYKPEIFTDEDIEKYPLIENLIGTVKSCSVYDLCVRLGITSFKEHGIFKSYTTNYDNSGGYRTVSVQSCHKKAIVNDIRMSRMVIDNQVEGGLLVVKPKTNTIKESFFILDKVLSFLHKDDYTIEIASEMNLKRPKKASSSAGVDSSGFITGIRTAGKNKVYDKDIDESINEYIYIETDGSYNRIVNTDTTLTNIMLSRDENYIDILPSNDGSQYKRVLLITTATIKKMKLEDNENWHKYEDVANKILSSDGYIKGVVNQTVFSMNKGYSFNRNQKIVINSETLPIFKKYAIEFNAAIINDIVTVDDDGDSILLSDVIDGFDERVENPAGIKSIILNKRITVSKKEILEESCKIINDMTEKQMLYYMDGSYDLYG